MKNRGFLTRPTISPLGTHKDQTPADLPNQQVANVTAALTPKDAIVPDRRPPQPNTFVEDSRLPLRPAASPSQPKHARRFIAEEFSRRVGRRHHKTESLTVVRFRTFIGPGIAQGASWTLTMDNLPDPICIFRRDPSLNMARFYRIEIQNDLFGQTTVERTWGRIGGRGQSRIHSYSSTHSAVQAAFRLLQAKERRGYRRPV